MTNNLVQVAADSLGNVIGVSANNPEYGYVRITQKVTEINDGGWLKNGIRSTLIKGKVKDLQEAGFKADQPLPGKLVVKESLIPFNEKNPDRDMKIAGATGVPCLLDDQPIYRQVIYTTDVTAQDDLIPHNNQDQIREAQAILRKNEVKAGITTL